MASITEIAKQFFAACEAGKGWEGCRAYCKSDATFSSQAGAVADLRTLQQYADWMKGLLTILEDGRYEVKSFATDDERSAFSRCCRCQQRVDAVPLGRPTNEHPSDRTPSVPRREARGPPDLDLTTDSAAVAGAAARR